jgi:anti-sigma regulatory factor (Ser/Thr protein kinase)
MNTRDMTRVGTKKRTVRSSSEASFQRRLNIAFHQMKTKQFRFVRKLAGAIYTSVFPKSLPITAVPPKLTELMKILELDVDEHSFIRKQIFEHLKNSCAHGGDALVAARRYKAFKHGRIRNILEVIVWDKGDGIPDLKTALQPGRKSRSHPFTSLHGAGKGLDFIVSYEDAEKTIPRFAADELIIETDFQKVERKSITGSKDPYRFLPTGKKVSGTKITVRFWL